MMARPRSVLLDAPLETDPRGTWRNWDHEADDDHELASQVASFESLDNPAGIAASRWLREDAYENDGMSRTRLLVTDERVEGFIATSFGTVELTEGGMKQLPVPRKLRRRQAPALLLCWIARHRDSQISGEQLMLTAVGLARQARRNSGLVALTLDPYDDEVSKMWQAAPWHFQKCRRRDNDRPTRLYLPI
jgi:hypothetical protein